MFNIRKEANLIAYADDISSLITVNNVNNIINPANILVKLFTTWIEGNLRKNSPNKTRAVFSRPKIGIFHPILTYLSLKKQ